jgi:hypothetical protein
MTDEHPPVAIPGNPYVERMDELVTQRPEILITTPSAVISGLFAIAFEIRRATDRQFPPCNCGSPRRAMQGMVRCVNCGGYL